MYEHVMGPIPHLQVLAPQPSSQIAKIDAKKEAKKLVPLKISLMTSITVKNS